MSDGGGPASRPSKIQQALERAALALRSQRPEEAERLCVDVLKTDRDNTAAAQIVGIARLALGRPQEAVEPLQRAVRGGDDPAVETWLAKALAAAGRGDEALDQLRRTAERRPPYPLAFLELGEALGAAGRFDEGVAVLERGLALVPAADGLKIAVGYLHLARNDRASARRAFQQVRAAAPGRQDAMVGLAQVLALDGEYAEAADLYRRALALRPDNAGARIALAKCLLELGDRDGGEAVLRSTVRSASQLAGPAITALAATSHGRFFLRPSAAARFLKDAATEAR